VGVPELKGITVDANSLQKTQRTAKLVQFKEVAPKPQNSC